MSVKDLVLLPKEMKKSRYQEGIQGHEQQMVHTTKMMQGPGRLACALIEKWGMVTAETDGEDSAGRSKQRRSTPAELVQFACDVADLTFKELDARGWFLEVPLPTKVAKEVQEEA